MIDLEMWKGYFELYVKHYGEPVYERTSKAAYISPEEYPDFVISALHQSMKAAGVWKEALTSE